MNKEDFERLLAVLHPEPAQAAVKYEQLRVRLIRYLAWEGVSFPEELADEVLNRLARKIETGERIHSIGGLTFGIARLVVLEDLRRQKKHQNRLRQMAHHSVNPGGKHRTAEIRLACLEKCLAGLEKSNRDLLLDYYREGGYRKIEIRAGLAARLGISLNALRNRILRLKGGLLQCVERCCLREESKP